MSVSTAYIILQEQGYQYHFDGVTAVSAALSLKVTADGDSSSPDSDFSVTARNEPDTVTLSVIASDTGSSVSGWAKQTLRTLAQIKEKLLLCKVVTPFRTYPNMLLTSISVRQDDTVQDGWAGDLTFTGTSVSAGAAKSSDNASTPVSSGTVSARKVPAESVGSPSSGSVLRTILKEAGIA